MKKRTKIICTLGPAVDSDEAVEALIEAGMDVARLNFSHGSHEEQLERINRVKRIREKLGTPTAIMLDTKGPEIRTGLLVDGAPVALSAGDTIALVPKPVEGNSLCVSQSFPDLAKYVHPGDQILVDDGLIGLKVTSVVNGDVICRVENPGILGQRKSINIPGVNVPLPAVTEQDKKDLLFGIEQEVDYVAASFIRDGAGVAEVRNFLAAHGGADIRIVSKIESAEAVANIDDIIAATDGVMVARGDLGVEVPAQRVPHIQKTIIRKCNRESKPVITATQMLDSMIRNPRPTRAEVADVANAIYDGTDCIMLSGETANGAHPLAAVQTMVDIARDTEPFLFDERFPDRRRTHARPSLAVGIAAVQTAENLDAACIVAPTMSGRTARLISNLRPKMPIFAVTPFPKVRRQLQLSWGVVPLMSDVQGDLQHVITTSEAAVVEAGGLAAGDLAVITAGDRENSPAEDNAFGQPGVSPTNVMYVVQAR